MVVATSAVAVAWALAALVTVRAHPRLGAVCAVPAVLAGLGAIAEAGDHPGAATAVACLVPGAVALFLLALPDGTVGSGVRWWAAGGVLGAGAVAGVALAVTGRGVHPAVVAGAAVAAGIAAMPAAHQRYRLARGATRERLLLVGAGAVLCAAVAVASWGLAIAVGWDHAGNVAIAGLGLVGAGVAAGGWGAARFRATALLDAAVTAGALVGAVAVGAGLAVLALGRLPGPGEYDVAAAMLLGAAAAATVFGPLRRLAGDALTRIAHGDRQPPEDVVRTFVERATRGVPDDELLLQLVESLRRTMAASGAEVWTGTAGTLERAVALPTRPADRFAVEPSALPVLVQSGVVGPAWLELWVPRLLENRSPCQLRAAPACHSGELLGLVVVERALDDDAFTEDDDRALGELGRRLGVVLDNVQLNSALRSTLDDLQRTNEELRASRSRLVAAADAERRRIERNLHDGAQQYLVALAVNMRLARDMLGDDPAAAREMLEQLDGDIRDAIAQVRELAHGIYPPLLVQAGLAEALRAASSRSPVPVRIDVDGVRRQPTDVEAAVYFCCLEALQNATKHAPDAAVTIRLWQDDGNLRFEVTDDGPGFDPARIRLGHGFENMSDRVGAIGGTVRWESVPGTGTRVVGSIPCVAAEAP
jgi:signal transduction histidine kinase